MITKYFNTTLRCPAHELPAKLREMEANIETYRQMYPGYAGEEIFIESSAYMTLIGAAQHTSTLPIALRKGDGTSVGTVFGITARSSVFTPVKQRDEENVPSLTIQYRMLG